VETHESERNTSFNPLFSFFLVVLFLLQEERSGMKKNSAQARLSEH